LRLDCFVNDITCATYATVLQPYEFQFIAILNLFISGIHIRLTHTHTHTHTRARTR